MRRLIAGLLVLVVVCLAGCEVEDDALDIRLAEDTQTVTAEIMAE